MKYATAKLIIALFFTLGLVSCDKEALLNVDIESLNPDDPLLNTELDEWLQATFLDEYNMNVVYRYNRYYHGTDNNVTPVKTESVRPMMETVLDGFILPYRDVAGATFAKSYIPKEWVLFGSNAYPSSGSPIAGTAAGGRRITLYGLNNFSLSGGFATGRLSVIHHEFTHILNQLVAMPTDFETISKADYRATWSTTPIDTAHKYGFVSSYASGSPGEDYAETVAALIVNGQSWYDNWANTSSELGRSRLRQKEQNVINYFTTGFNMDFKKIQQEVQLYIKNTIKDPSVTLSYWLDRNLYKTMTINLEDGLYESYGISSEFEAAYNGLKQAVFDWSETGRYHMDYLQFRFESDEVLTLRLAFTAEAGGTQFVADYSFSYSVDVETGEVVFTKVEQAGEEGSWANAREFEGSFRETIQAYLTGGTFIADWLPVDIAPALYTKYGGFYEADDTANYFYGPLALTF